MAICRRRCAYSTATAATQYGRSRRSPAVGRAWSARRRCGRSCAGARRCGAGPLGRPTSRQCRRLRSLWWRGASSLCDNLNSRTWAARTVCTLATDCTVTFSVRTHICGTQATHPSRRHVRFARRAGCPIYHGRALKCVHIGWAPRAPVDRQRARARGGGWSDTDDGGVRRDESAGEWP